MNQSSNPLLQPKGLPAFEHITSEHAVPAVQARLAEAKENIAKLEGEVQPTLRSAVQELDLTTEALERAWGPVMHLSSVANNDGLREAIEELQPSLVQFGLRVSQSKPLFDALKGLRESQEWDSLDPGQQRVVEQRLHSARNSGIELEGEKQARFNEIAAQLSKLQTDFSNHVLDATKAWGLDLETPAQVAGLSDNRKALMAQSWAAVEEGREANAAEGPWRATLDGPCFMDIQRYADDASLREATYRAYLSRASSGDLDNAPLIKEILKLRNEKAQLLGYEHYGALSLSSKMAELDEVFALADKLVEASLSPAEKEFDELKVFAAERGHQGELKHWDVGYYSRIMKEERYAYSEEELRPWFPLPRILSGLFDLCTRLFGITFKEATSEVECWHKDVAYYRVYDAKGDEIAGFYLDPYTRPGTKRGGAWMNVCLGRWRFPAGDLQLPVAYLICNGTPPIGDQPSLMTFSEVLTLFHEFGHGLQHMLTTIDEPGVAGISGVEWDAVELPSQFMENWCYHRETLLEMARHWETGEPLSDEVYNKIVAARNFGAARGMLRQLTFLLTDLRLHTEWTEDQEANAVYRDVAKRTSLLTPLDEDNFLCAFGHIFAGGYAAGYFSYKWAEVLSADAFSAFEEAGLDNPEAIEETGRKFRDTVLALGGSKHPSEVYRAFRGRDASPEALLRHNGLLEG